MVRVEVLLRDQPGALLDQLARGLQDLLLLLVGLQLRPLGVGDLGRLRLPLLPLGVVEGGEVLGRSPLRFGDAPGVPELGRDLDEHPMAVFEEIGVEVLVQPRLELVDGGLV